MKRTVEFESLSLRKIEPENKQVKAIKKEVRQKCAKHVSSVVFMVEEPNEQQLENMIKRIRINDCGRNVDKRWYVDYIAINKETGKQERKRAYGYINKEKDPDKRYELLLALKLEVESEVINAVFNGPDEEISGVPAYSNVWFCQRFLKLKKQSLKHNSTQTYKTVFKVWLGFLSTKNLHKKHASLIRKETLNEFKYYYSKKVCNRTVNNTLNCIRTLYNFIIDEFDNVIIKNPVRGVSKLPSRSENNVAYTTEQTRKIGEYLKKNDKYTYQFIKFIGEGFLRPADIRELKVKDIDFVRNTITIQAGNTKTSRRMNKKMLQCFSDYLKTLNIDQYNPEYFVFGRNGVPGPKKCSHLFFRRRFRKVKKKFGLTRAHTLYGFRHTFVSNLLDNGAKPHEIMKYTGHSDMKAFQCYAQSVLNKPAEDLTGFITINF